MWIASRACLFHHTVCCRSTEGAALFERYNEIDNSNEKRIAAIKSAGLYNDEWIATEKVHGANFGIYSINHGKGVRFAKRSGLLPPHEHFFGYHILIPELTRYAKVLHELVQAKLGYNPHTVILNGELFGGKYDHPHVAKNSTTIMVGGRPRTISAVQCESFPQYSPSLHFYAFDIKYRSTGSDDGGDSSSSSNSLLMAHDNYMNEMDRAGALARGGSLIGGNADGADATCCTLTYDEARRLFEQVPGLLYARAIIRGPMSKVAAFDVENFETTIPNLVGMGNTPLKGNWAEGLVVRHARHGESGFRPHAPTMLKFKCTAFQEISTDRLSGPRVDEMAGVRGLAIRESGVQLPAMESVIQDAPMLEAAQFLLQHVCEQRLSSVLSKIGLEPFESQAMSANELATQLARDALKDFLKEASPLVVTAPLLTRRAMVRYCLFESRKLVCARWKKILDR